MSYLCDTCRYSFINEAPCATPGFSGTDGACLHCGHGSACHEVPSVTETSAPMHRGMPCSVCQEDAAFWVALGDLTLYLCESHASLCVECLTVGEEPIAHQGNVCASCKRDSPDSWAELAEYECCEGCSSCRR